MKTKHTVLLIALFVASGAVGRQALRDITEPDQALTPSDAPDETTPASPARDEVVVEKQNFVTRPLKLEKVGEKSGSITAASRAWTSLVGWHPGGSAFADEVTHEVHSLISINR